MKKYEVKIEGVTPYMQHRMDDISLEQWEKSRGKLIERPEVAKEDLVRAQFHMYSEIDGTPYIPAQQIQGALINAGGFVKSKVGNARKSMKNVVAAMFLVTPDKIKLNNNWVVDKRSAVNKNIKARIITVRPKWEEWAANFTLLIDNDTITEETIKDIITYAGQYCGIGSYRPTNNGMFGRFKISEFKEVAL